MTSIYISGFALFMAIFTTLMYFQRAIVFLGRSYQSLNARVGAKHIVYPSILWMIFYILACR